MTKNVYNLSNIVVPMSAFEKHHVFKWQVLVGIQMATNYNKSNLNWSSHRLKTDDNRL